MSLEAEIQEANEVTGRVFSVEESEGPAIKRIYRSKFKPTKQYDLYLDGEKVNGVGPSAEAVEIFLEGVVLGASLK